MRVFVSFYIGTRKHGQRTAAWEARIPGLGFRYLKRTPVRTILREFSKILGRAWRVLERPSEALGGLGLKKKKEWPMTSFRGGFGMGPKWPEPASGNERLFPETRWAPSMVPESHWGHLWPQWHSGTMLATRFGKRALVSRSRLGPKWPNVVNPGPSWALQGHPASFRNPQPCP